MSDDDPRQSLSPAELDELVAGRHEAVAQALRSRGQPAAAGWVLEQIWDFAAAFVAYRDAGRLLDALRAAVESGRGDQLDAVLEDLARSDDATTLDDAVEFLRARRRPLDAARLLGDRDALTRADLLARGGDRLGAARTLADAGRPHEAYAELMADGAAQGPQALALAARVAWDLGDAEGAARLAQRRLRLAPADPEVATLLARSLASLGHDVAAQLVLDRTGARAGDEVIPGRYRVTSPLPGGLAGSAYAGFDRLTLQEVEIHLLTAESGEPAEVGTMEALARFAATAKAAADLGHPAIRAIMRVDARSGLLVLPRAEGPSLRTFIRPPGLRVRAPARARALVAFLLEGLAAAHARGLLHGWLLPSLMDTDALGRPLLPPFGAHHLSGLTATHTGSLEELMAVTAPELRAANAPTAAGDVYAVGVLLAALLTGELPPEAADGPDLALARWMSDPDPQARPDPAAALARLQAPVVDLRGLSPGGDPEAASRSSAEGTVRLAEGVDVLAGPSWDEDLLAALCAADMPWWQPILDRAERVLVLAPWPEGARALAADDPHWRRLVPPEWLEVEPPALRQAIEARLGPQAIVVTPSGELMLALDVLLP